MSIADSRWFRGVLLALLGLAAIWDFRTRRVPPAVSVPLLALGAGRCLAEGNVPAVLALVLALWNVRRGEPWTHGALALAGLGLAAATGRASFAVPVFLVLAVYRMWRSGWIGGGDGKLMMAVGMIHPEPGAVLALAGGWFLWGLVWLVIRYRRAALTAAALSAAGQLRPSGPLDEVGVPGAAGIALGYAVFLVGGVLMR
jgi:Flp pilus assembly protein protease CpaA